jgi:hypothetical protein
MFRSIIAGLALAASLAGCTTSGSTMDILPREARPASAPFASGDWCTVEGEAAPFTVRSQSDACLHLEWRRGRRFYAASGKDPDSEQRASMEIAFATLQPGVLLAQADRSTMRMIPETDEDREQRESMPPFSHMVFMAQGEAIAGVPFDVTKETFDAIVARHPAIHVEGEGTNRIVTAGAPDNVMDYLRDLTAASLKPEPSSLTLYVRDRRRADHPVSASQQRDIDALMARYRSLPRPPRQEPAK